jgi:hypothetical protein
MDFGEDLEWDILWLRIARNPPRTLGPEGTHHLLFSLGFALRRSEPRK